MYTYRIYIVATNIAKLFIIRILYTVKQRSRESATIKPARVVVIASWFRVERGANDTQTRISSFVDVNKTESYQPCTNSTSRVLRKTSGLIDLQMPLANRAVAITLPVTVHLRAKTCRGNDFIVQTRPSGSLDRIKQFGRS